MKSWNEGVSFVETLDQSIKDFFMFGPGCQKDNETSEFS